MTPTPQELKPCPFCGGKAEVLHDQSSDYSQHWDYSVSCTNRDSCWIQGYSSKDKEDAIRHWNTRHSAEPVDGECNHPIMWRCEYCEKRKPVDAGELDAAIARVEEFRVKPFGCPKYTDLGILLEAAKAHRASLSNVTSDGWMPIESAPKDGTPITLYAYRFGWEKKSARVCGAYHHGTWRIYGTAQGEPYSGNKEKLESIQWLDEVTPTHWMPLPKPPSNPTQAKGEV